LEASLLAWLGRGGQGGHGGALELPGATPVGLNHRRRDKSGARVSVTYTENGEEEELGFLGLSTVAVHFL
jgi:hypothetical protein